jgi:hypothetical protein
MRIPLTNQTATTNVACSEEELKKENERAFIKSCLACMSAEDIVKMLLELGIEDEVYNEIDYYDDY